MLLDMDGTLLDLAFDNHFWQELVPETYDAKQDIFPRGAQDYIRQQYHVVQHILNRYYLDYWNKHLDPDICAMTTEQGPRVVLREDTVSSLDALKVGGKRCTLLINMHPHSLAMKLKHIGPASHFDLLLPIHTSDHPKEDQRLWHTVAEETGMSVEKTLFIDDSEPILDATTLYGIRCCLGTTNPNSGIAKKQYTRHLSPNNYRRLVPSLM